MCMWRCMCACICMHTRGKIKGKNEIEDNVCCFLCAFYPTLSKSSRPCTCIHIRLHRHTHPCTHTQGNATHQFTDQVRFDQGQEKDRWFPGPWLQCLTGRPQQGTCVLVRDVCVLTHVLRHFTHKYIMWHAHAHLCNLSTSLFMHVHMYVLQQKTVGGHRRLNESMSTLIEDYGLVSYLPLDITVREYI